MLTTPTTTHEVLNQVPPLEGRNLFEDHAALREGLEREGVAAGELAPQNVELSAAALVGALGEALVGPLSWVGGTNYDVDADALVADLVSFCLRSVTEEAL